MEKIVWDDALYSVGHSHMDSHHKHLIDLVNSLVELNDQIALAGAPTSPHITEYQKIVVAISNYINLHFSVEEALLQSVNYPYLHEQTMAHSQYVDAVAGFYVESDIAQLSEVVAYLGSWVINHILIEDMKYKDFVR
ncbi:MAG: hypothetical protein HN344_02285 [Gammaproteobacteria bacterium]|jgi:hemerythrin|nr:hypothetical protein [Gammaproteobacteria bacterium]